MRKHVFLYTHTLNKKKTSPVLRREYSSNSIDSNFEDNSNRKRSNQNNSSNIISNSFMFVINIRFEI